MMRHAWRAICAVLVDGVGVVGGMRLSEHRDGNMLKRSSAIWASLTLCVLALLFASCSSGGGASSGAPASVDNGESVGSTAQALPKGNGGVNGDDDYCTNASNKCTAGEGDCDGNVQCSTGLSCVSLSGPRYGLPNSVDVCMPSTCKNNILNTGETAIDCGGGGCGPCYPACSGAPGGAGFCTHPGSCLCGLGQGDCAVNSECQGGLLCNRLGPQFGFGPSVRVCSPQHCVDRTQNFGETGLDCGGSDCGNCLSACSGPPGSSTFCDSCLCGLGQGDCDYAYQCAAGLVCLRRGAQFGQSATTDVCVPDHCGNGILDAGQGETGIDCGGQCGTCNTTCTGTLGSGTFCDYCLCTNGQGDCDSDSQCATGLTCTRLGPQFGLSAYTDVCVPPHCGNALKDDDETGVDCGGSTCGTCPPACTGELGTQEYCVGCRCSVGQGDCDSSAECEPGLACLSRAGVHHFTAGIDVCEPSHCANGVLDAANGETAIDCGGPCGACFGGDFDGGAKHACAVAYGRVRCWGDNAYGQIGDGTVIGRPSPTLVAGLPSNYVGVAAGRAHACAFSATGALKCWGDNSLSQLGNGTTSSALPVNVIGPPSGITKLRAGADFTCALTSARQVWCWGDNSSGQLGTGSTGGSRATPLQVAGITDAVDLAVGISHACVVLGNGGVSCWGLGSSGQLGDGSTTNRVTPVATGLTGAQRVAAGAGHSCAVANGQVWCWGNNTWNALGTGGGLVVPAPAQVTGIANAQYIGASDRSTCATTTAGALYCWGASSEGQVGAGTTLLAYTSPTLVAGVSVAKEVGGGGDFICGRTGTPAVDEYIYCFGNDRLGALGKGTVAAQLTPRAIASQPGPFTAVSAGDLATCGVSSGTIYCWGSNDSGQLGDGTQLQRRTPTAIPGYTTATGVAAGARHGCAVLANGSAICWGANDKGQLGNNGTATSLVPVPVTGLPPASKVFAGQYASCALLSDGTMRCWGANDHGQLGNGATSSHSTVPVTVTTSAGGPALASITAAATGIAGACAIVTGGSVYCWGDNRKGQMGNGTTSESQPTPALVTNLPNPATAVAVGENHACAIVTSGSVYCWGDNQHSQLGNTSVVGLSTTPVLVGTPGPNPSAISAWGSHTCVINSDHRVSCWGQNDRGQIGNDLTTDTATPFAILGVYNLLTAGAGHTCFQKDGTTLRCQGDNDYGQTSRGSAWYFPAPAVWEPDYTPADFACVPECGTKQCGDDPADGCGTGGTCAGFCPPGGVGCHNDVECATGTVCAGRTLDSAIPNICVPADCRVDPVLAGCGYEGAPCGPTCNCSSNCPTKHCGDDPADGCGDTCTGYCPPGGTGCHSDAECASGSTCVTSVTTTKCVPQHCLNKVLDEDETSVDCGGPTCLACDDPCVPQCQGKQCGDDLSDKCGGACEGPCGPGQPGCNSSSDCALGYSCGFGIGARFGLAAGTNVCWPQGCENQDSALLNGGVDPLTCGLSPACTPQCSPGDRGPDGCGSYCGGEDCPTGQSRGSSGMCSPSVSSYYPNGSNFPNWPALSFPQWPLGTLAGAIPGQFSVSDQGRATYRMPIEVPPGRLGLQPSLALVHNGTKANGMLGIGWGLSGLSSITRCRKIIARDGVAREVLNDDSDTYCLDGQALIRAASDPYYRTEIDNFSQIFARGVQVGSGPNYFEVYTKDGRILRYGFTDDASLATTSTVKRVWALDRVLDAAGNRMDIRYLSGATQLASETTEQVNARLRAAAGLDPQPSPPSPDQVVEAELLPSVIAYGGVEDLSVQPHTRFVSFSYERRPDPQYHYVQGLGKNLVNRVKSITTHVGTREAKRYLPHYAVQPSLSSNYLAFNAKDEVIDRIDFESVDWSTNRLEPNEPDTQTVHRLGGTTFHTVPVSYNWNDASWAATVPPYVGCSLDLNGDGRADLIYSAGPTGHKYTMVRLTTQVDGAYTYVDRKAIVSNGLDAVDGVGPNGDLPAWHVGDPDAPRDPLLGPFKFIPQFRTIGLDIDRDGRDELLFGKYYLSFLQDDGANVVLTRRTDLGPELPPTIGVVYENETYPVWQQNGLRGDWNGDGLTDLAICYDSINTNPPGASGFHSYLSEMGPTGVVHLVELGSPVGLPLGLPCNTLEVLDSDDDGKDEIARPDVFPDTNGQNAQREHRTEGFHHYLVDRTWLGEPLDEFPTTLTLGTSAPPVPPHLSGDFNGDGLKDFISTEPPLPLPNPGGRAVNPSDVYPLTLMAGVGNGTLKKQVLFMPEDAPCLDLEAERDWTHPGHCAWQVDLENAVVMDWNGDGRDDIIIGNNTEPAHLGETIFNSITGTVHLPTSNWPGKSDGIWLGEISGSDRLTFTKVTNAHCGKLQVIPDVDGDRIPELVDKTQLRMMSVMSVTNNVAGRLYAVIDGLGLRTDVYYGLDLGARYSRATCTSDIVAGYDCMNAPAGLVTRYRETQTWNGQSTPFVEGPEYSFRYYDARRGLNGRGSYGFAKRQIESSTVNGSQRTTTIDYYNKDFVRAGIRNVVTERVLGPNQQDDFQNFSNGSDAITTRTWSVRHPAGTTSTFAVNDSTTNAQYDIGLQTRLLSKQSTTFTVNNDGDETARTVEYYSGESLRATQVVQTDRFASRGRVRGPVERITTSDRRGSGTLKLRVVGYTYDDRGLLETVERDPDGYESTLTYHKVKIVPDPMFGTPESVCQSDVTGATNERCVYYEQYSDGHIFPTEIRETGPGVDYVSHRANSEVDGQLLLSWDAGGRLSEFAYDPFGRPAFVDSPTAKGKIRRELRGSSTTTVFPDVVVNGAMVVFSDFGEGETEEVFDAFGHKVQSVTPGLLGVEVNQEFVYDNFGQLEKVTLPHSQWDNTRGRISYERDGQERVKTVAQTDGPSGRAQVTSYSYPNRFNSKKTWFSDLDSVSARVVTKVTDLEGGISQAQVLGARGEVLRAIETTPTSQTDTTTTYSYAAFDVLTTIQAPGNDTTTIVPDDYGRTLSSSNATTGSQSASYNGFDETVTEKDALNKSKYFKYDGLGRVIEEHEGTDATGQLIAKWVFDGEEENTKGLLARAYRRFERDKTHGSWTKYTYTSTGLPRDIEYVLGGSPTDHTTGESFVLTYGYGSLVPGRVTHLLYPTKAGPFSVLYSYDDAGNLKKVGPVYDASDPEVVPPTPYWELAEAENGLWPKKEVFKNVAVTERSYFVPGNCAAGDSCISGMPKQITTRLGGSVRFDESYTYDKSSNVRSIVPNGDVTARTAFDYDKHDQLAGVTTYPSAARTDVSADASGDLTAASTYLYEPGRPHILNTVQRPAGAITYHFDPNGNLEWRTGTEVPGGRQDFHYNDFGMPADIVSAGQTTYLEYDAAEHRIAKVKASAPASDHIYIGDVFERIVDDSGTRYVYNIFAGDQQVARFTRTAVDGPITERYLHQDRLGSTRLVSGDLNFGTQTRSFSAYGQSGQFTDVLWSGQSGFTGHEHDEELGLVNMRGRLYDPLAQRFIQPDPVVADPTTAIGLNPYPYARNNPLKFFDPTGFCEESVKEESGKVGVTIKACAPETESGSGGGPVRPSGTEGPPSGIEEPWRLPGDGLAHVNGWSGDEFPDADQSWREVPAGPATYFAPPVSHRVYGEPEMKGTPGQGEAWENIGKGMFFVGTFLIQPQVLIGRAAVGAATAPGRVFWSGGVQARAAAAQFARANGKITLEMTRVGRILDKLTTPRTAPYLKPLWDVASKRFAQGAQGTVDVFNSASSGVKIGSTWARVEYKALTENLNQIVYHLAP